MIAKTLASPGWENGEDGFVFHQSSNRGLLAIEKLIKVLDQRKDDAIQRTFKGVSQHFTEIFKEIEGVRVKSEKSDELKATEGLGLTDANGEPVDFHKSRGNAKAVVVFYRSAVW